GARRGFVMPAHASAQFGDPREVVVDDGLRLDAAVVLRDQHRLVRGDDALTDVDAQAFAGELHGSATRCRPTGSTCGGRGRRHAHVAAQVDPLRLAVGFAFARDGPQALAIRI